MDSLPKSTTAWVHSEPAPFSHSFESTLQKTTVPLPELGPYDVLVRIHAASLNYRDIMIPRSIYPFPVVYPLIPLSDGAGTVVSVGSAVSSLSPGDNVITLFQQDRQSGPLTMANINSSLGGPVPGVLREHAVFPESGIMKAPTGWSHEEASTLPCAAVTAWNALRGIKSGDSVLVQGTGGVSLFALQFAKMAGACVVATTSSAEKEERLKRLGADVVVNSKENTAWGEIAKKLSPRGEGVDYVIEVGGAVTMGQSFKAVKMDGTIIAIGFRAGMTDEVQPSTPCQVLTHLCSVRGVFVGSREMAEEMVKAIEVGGLKPIIDQSVWGFDQVPEALAKLEDGKHFGKVVIKLNQ